MGSHISEEEYKVRLKKIQDANKSKERKRKLKEEKVKAKPKKKFKLPSTSKLLLLVVFAMCIEILVFAQYAMVKLGDISAMYTLIGVPVTLVPIVIGYLWKSKAENSVGGITYDMAMKNKCLEDEIKG